jgi:hypothetical protein
MRDWEKAHWDMASLETKKLEPTLTRNEKEIMTRIKAILSVYLLLICCVLPLLAQSEVSADSVVPGMVKFTGVLNDATGKPLTGTVGVTFLLYTEQFGGTPLWMETQNVQADKNGHFSVMLGSVTSHGIPAKTFAAGEARWLGVQPSGRAELPRVMLASVPYSLKALDAETLGGRPASSFLSIPARGAKGTSPAAEQPNEIVCVSGLACQKGFLPLFATHGGSAKVKDSIVAQDGTGLLVGGSETVAGNFTSGGRITASSDIDAAGNVNGKILFATESLVTNGLVFSTGLQASSANVGNGSAVVQAVASASGNAGITAGVFGASNSQTGRGLWGQTVGANSTAVYGESFGGAATGVFGFNNSASGIGVDAVNDSGGDAIFAEATGGGFAAFFDGNVDVDGTLSKAAGSFKIDHPLDPANKYLYHSFVESPDMMNLYNGTVTTDAQSKAIVDMPEWFEALNRDFRYQPTVMGQFAQAIIAREMVNHSFTIQTDKPNVKVSWQVTGIRHDVYANAHRIPVEEAKSEKERGFYLRPELFGAPAEKSIAAARHPNALKLAKEAKSKFKN